MSHDYEGVGLKQFHFFRYHVAVEEVNCEHMLALKSVCGVMQW